MLHSVVNLLIKEYGASTVSREVEHQVRVHNVNRLAAILRGGSTKINRIKVVWKIGFLGGLKEAKEWVETNFADDGNGDPH